MAITVDQTTEPVNLIWAHGDNQAQTFRFLAGPDEPMDLTGIEINSSARSTLGELFPLVVYVPDPASGIVQLHSPQPPLDPDLYDYDVQFRTGDSVATWIRGRIRVQKDVTG